METALPKLTEKQFMSQVLQLAGLRGWHSYHTHDSRRSVPGFPDLLLIRRERLLVAELKVRKNKVTLEQRAWLELFAGAGAESYVWRETDWQSIERTLE